MKQRTHITITQADKSRLQFLINSRGIEFAKIQDQLDFLQEELNRAIIVDSTKVAAKTVTMNSTVVVKNLLSGKPMTITLVYPDNVDSTQNKISVLSPLGTAIIGYSEGDLFVWNGKQGNFRFFIEKVIYQPEAAGDYHL